MKNRKLFVILILISLLAGFVQAQEPGDANGDGTIDIIDALVTAQYYVDINPDPFYPSAADVFGCDGNIDIIDALLIAQYYVGLITRFPCAQTNDDTTIEYTRSGGFAGITETISIRTAEKLIIVNNKRRRELSDTEMERLLTLLHSIDISYFPQDTGPCCCDRFFYEIAISSSTTPINGTGEWSDCTIENRQVPQGLLDLVALLNELAQPAGNDFTIDYEIYGGIAGIGESIYIQSVSQLIIVNGVSMKLSDTEIDRLWNVLNTIDASRLPGDTEPCCCDLYDHKITLTSNISSLNGTGIWTSCTEMAGQVPQELLDLVTLLRELAQARISKLLSQA